MWLGVRRRRWRRRVGALGEWGVRVRVPSLAPVRPCVRVPCPCASPVRVCVPGPVSPSGRSFVCLLRETGDATSTETVAHLAAAASAMIVSK